MGASVAHGVGERLAQDRRKAVGDICGRMLVGTGDSPLTVPFYQRCGFTEHHRVKNFFLDNYDHPIVECGVTLCDMVYLSRTL